MKLVGVLSERRYRFRDEIEERIRGLFFEVGGIFLVLDRRQDFNQVAGKVRGGGFLCSGNSLYRVEIVFLDSFRSIVGRSVEGFVDRIQVWSFGDLACFY